MTILTGFVAAAIAVLGFGSNFVPVKKYEMGDGMTFQMIMGLGIWSVAIFYEIYRSAVYFYPFAMLGGLIWATGNILTVPIIKMVGMALGLAIWSGTSMLVGWATGKFGLLGTEKDDSVKIPALNYAGIILVLCAMILFFNVKPAKTVEKIRISMQDDSVNQNLIYPKSNIENSNLSAVYDREGISVQQKTNILQKKNDDMTLENQSSWVDNLTLQQKQLFGIACSICSGVCYGLCFCPAQYCVNHYSKTHDNYSSNLEDYSFSHFCGILLATMFYFILYSIYMSYHNKKPHVNAQALLPSIISGILWGIAQIGFFTATNSDNLGTTTSFPIVSGSPQIVASIWGVIIFKEVKGKRDLIILGCAMLVGLIGVICIALSKL